MELCPDGGVGPSVVRDRRGPFPEAEPLPTGGIDVSNARRYLDAGAAAIGVGGALIRADGAGRRELVDAVRADDVEAVPA